MLGFGGGQGFMGDMGGRFKLTSEQLSLTECLSVKIYKKGYYFYCFVYIHYA